MEYVMSNVPKLRFKEFSGKWEKKTVGDVGKVSMCKRILKDQTTSDGDIPFYKIGTFGKEPDAFISKVIFEEFKAKYSFPKEGEILISASGTIGRTVIYDGSPSYFQDSNIVWIANNEKLVLNKFLLYCYENTRWNTENTTIARLYNENLRNIPLILPSKQEQDKIASFLTSVDTKIEQLSRKEELLQQYKKGVMQKIFSQEIRFKADDGSEFPDWEENNIEEIVKEYNDKTTETDQYPILSSTKDGIVLQSEYFDKQTASTDNTGYKIVPKGYFTYRSMSDTGSFTFNQQNLINIGVVSPAYPVFKCNSKIVERFLEITLNNSPEIIQQILMLKEGGTRLALGFNKFKKLYISLPCLEEQTKIANFLSSIDSKIEQVQKQLNSTKEFKKALLQQMFV